MFTYLVSIEGYPDFTRKICPLRMLEDQVGFEDRQI